MKDNVIKLGDCYGCGVCVIACPRNIINLELNKDGFYSPSIHNLTDCIECGICLDICAFNHEETANSIKPIEINAYGCWSKDDSVRANSTTGGMGYEIARRAVLDGYKACVVEYDIENQLAKHYIAKTVESLSMASGTKYIPSWTEFGFRKIRLKEKNIVFGLPCQIDSFRRLIRKYKVENNFYLVDLLCYGTPSLLLWQNYIGSIKKEIGVIEKVKFRSKTFGWHNSACIEIKGTKSEIVKRSHECEFYKLFFTDSCLNKCCHDRCKYKLLSSSADIRIGDFWGKRYEDNDFGVNVLIAMTTKGNHIVESLLDRCVFEPVTLEEAMDKQMTDNAPSTPFRRFALWGFRNHVSLKLLSLIIRYGNIIIHSKEALSIIRSKIRPK